MIVYAQPAQAVDVDNFVIDTYDVQLYLDRDGENRSTLKTVESITATFPAIDQNHGLERILVGDYDGHTTNLKVESVTDVAGKPHAYSLNGNVLRIGNADTYVHGVQTYKITYTQRDITKQYSDTGKDEFYWDAIGVEWRVPITAASATIHLSDALKKARQTDGQCYWGASGSNERCEVAMEPDGAIAMRVTNLAAKQGMSVAVGFAPGTFAEYKASFAEEMIAKAAAAWMIANVIVGPLVLLLGAIALWRKYKKFKSSDEIRAVENQPLVRQYLPPSGRSVLESAAAYKGAVDGKAVTAQIIDWAVRHYVDIRQTKEKSLFSAAEYTIEAKKSFEDLSEQEQKLATTLFEELPAPGDSFTTKKMGHRSMEITGSLTTRLKDIKEGDLFTKNEAAAKWFKKMAVVVGIVGLLLLLNVPVLILAIIALAVASMTTFLNVEGAKLKAYLDGLKEYISVAETDRLAMLQSPEGAEKIGLVNADDTGALVKLYERVLPYAILFGQEKEWSKQLGRLYEESGTSPDWNPGTTAFNAAAFSGMVNSFSGAVSSASSYNSSSGGSSGGGSSGGGGGGGGGGGW